MFFFIIPTNRRKKIPTIETRERRKIHLNSIPFQLEEQSSWKLAEISNNHLEATEVVSKPRLYSTQSHSVPPDF